MPATINMLYITYGPVYGGPHNTIEVMEPLLRERGTTTTVLLPDNGPEAAQRLRDHGLDVVTQPLHRMRALPDPRVHARYLRELRSEVDGVARLVRERGIDVVSTNSLPNLHGGLAARRAGVACVWELIDSFPPPLARHAYMPFVRRLSDVVMTTGRQIAKQHPGTTSFGERWISFYPCVDVARFAADPQLRAAARAELGLAPDDVVIGNVGNLNPMKGHAHFIRAAAELRRTHPRTRFVILGGSYEHFRDYTDGLWAQARSLGLDLDRDLVVRNAGDRVHVLAQALDQFWMTSEPRSEGIPTVIGEAKALGLPVVATDVGSSAEAVTEGVSGFVVSPRDHLAIAARARQILDSPGLAPAMSAAARAESERQFAAHNGADAHQRAYELAIEHRARRSAGEQGSGR